MTNAPKSRKTHVVRIYGTNKKKEILHEMYADVERIDKSESRDKVNGVRQGMVRRFEWRDDPQKNDYLDPDTEDEISDQLKRKTELVKLCDPTTTTDFSDPEEWIPIRRIKKIRSRRNSQKNNVKQQQYEKLINDDIRDSRVVEARRFSHYETSIDDKAEKAADEDPNLKAYVVKGSDYTKLDGSDGSDDTKDEDQYIEHEVITKVIHKGNSVYYGNGNEPLDTLGPNGRQVRKTKFLNQYLIDESEPAKLKELGKNDINPPYRLDPFQNIVNINWGSLAVEFGDRNEDAPEKKK